MAAEPITITIPGFSGGEQSKDMYPQNDIEKQKAGLRSCSNMIVNVRGSVSNRPGTEYTSGAKETTKLSRLIPFVFNTEQAYMLEFGDSKMRVLKDGALVSRDLVDAAYKWTASGSGTGEFYVELAAGGNPGLLEPSFLLENSIKISTAVLGSLTASTWNYGDNDTLGYSTVYVRLSDDADPDSEAQGFVQVPFLIATPYPIADVATLNYEPSADTLFMFHGDYRRRKITRTADDAWTVTEVANTDGPYRPRVEGDEKVNVSLVHAAGTPAATSWTATASSAIFGDVAIGDAFRIGWQVPLSPESLDWVYGTVDSVASSTVITVSFPDTSATVTPAEEVVNNWDFSQGSTFWKDLSTDEPSLTTITYDLVNDLVTLVDSTVGQQSQVGQQIYLLSNRVYEINVEVGTIEAGAEVNIWVGHTPSAKQHLEEGALTTSDTTYTYEFKTSDEIDVINWVTISNLSSTAGQSSQIKSVSIKEKELDSYEWRLAAHNATYGFPSIGIIHEQRLWIGNTETLPQTVWASELGEFDSFGFHTPLRSTDSFSFEPATTQINGIEWMARYNGLNIGTAGAIWRLFSASGGAVSATDLNIKIDSNVSSLPLNPVVAGNSLIVAPRGMAAVSELTSSLEASGYIPRDLSLLASDLFENRRIIRWAYAKNPDSVIWCVLDDGTLLGLTYIKEYDVWAWHTHSTTGEGFKDVAVIPNSSDDNIDDVYFVVNRAFVATTNEYYIEQLNVRIKPQVSGFGFSFGTQWDYRFLDSALTLDNPVAISSMTGTSPTVVVSIAHGFSDGDQIRIENVYFWDGNGEVYVVSDKTVNNYKIKDLAGNYINVPAASILPTGGEARLMTTAISGLDHLEGKTVTVLADGRVESHSVASGAITLDNAASFVHAGLPYVSQIETHDIDAFLRSGNTQNKKKVVKKLSVYFKDSLPGKAGTTLDALQDFPVWQESDAGDVPALGTGFLYVKPESIHKVDERIIIQQTDPRPMTISRIVAEVEFNKG